MAYGVTTQWDDIHIKLGNYAPKDPDHPSMITPQSEITENAMDKLEEAFDEEAELRELLDDDMMDDDFLESYKQKRLEQIEKLKKGPQYGKVYTIDAKSYSKEVKEASQKSPVVLHLYQDFLKTCTLLNKHLKFIADKYPGTKFCKSISTKTIPNFPDNRLPTFLLFKDGKLLHNVNQVDKEVKLTQPILEKFFAGFGMIEYDFPDEADEEIEYFKNFMK